MRMLGMSVTQCSQERAIRRLVGFLDAATACYQFSGGFAENLHGSRWPLHDFDVDVTQRDLPRLAELLHPYSHHSLGLYEDCGRGDIVHFLRMRRD